MVDGFKWQIRKPICFRIFSFLLLLDRFCLDQVVHLFAFL